MFRIPNKIVLWLTIAVSLPTFTQAASIYETQTEFLDRAFSGSPPEPDVVWLSGERKAAVAQLLGHDYAALRLRYWCQGGRSAWVLNEIGKELPITVGVVINGSYITSLRVLTYRENRGGEVVVPAFTGQFDHVALASDGGIDRHIDGISGATLSVQALTRLANLALYLHQDSACNAG